MKKETIFMIHGMWGGPWYWKNYRDFLEKKGYRCVATTLRYHDIDPKDKPDERLGRMSHQDYAADLESEIRKLPGKPIIMGHSMGGLIAQILGSRGLASALVLLTPASPRGILALTPSVIRSFFGIMIRWGFWRKPMRQSFGAAVYSMLHLLPVDQQKKAYARFVYESGRAAFEIGFWPLDLKGGSRVDGTKLACPVLVIGGGQDRITPASVVRKVAARYADVSTYREFKDHAHWVIAEPGWQDIAAFVAEWLDRRKG